MVPVLAVLSALPEMQITAPGKALKTIVRAWLIG